MKFRYILVAILLLMTSQTAYSATESALKGEVVHADTGEPIPGATIFISELNRGAVSEEDGQFVIQNLDHGSYEVLIRAMGFTPVKKEVQFPEDDVIRIEMEPSVFQTQEVIITSSPIGRNIQYQPAQALNTQMLHQKAAPSLGEMLDGTPGVTTRSFGSAPARPVIRGFDGDRVLVMQNGERMGDLSSTAVDHAVAMDPLAMDRVEVVRGPASLLYGSSAIGGVVNMFSSDMPREWTAGTSGTVATHAATVNSMGAGMVRAQHGTDNFAATGSIIYREGQDLRTPEGRLPDTALNNLTYGGGVGYRSGDFETGLSISGLDYTYGLPEAIDDPDESIEIRMNRYNLQSISTLKMDRFFDHAELRIHYSDYSHDEIEMEREPDGSIDEELEISFDQQTISSSLVMRHRPVGAMEGAVGISFNLTDLKVGGVEALTPNASGYFAAGYIYEELGLSQSLTLKTGARLEYKQTFVTSNELFPDADNFEDRSDLIFSGAVGLNYSPSANWTAGVQAARAYRTPTIEELYSDAAHAAAGSYDVGDPTLENEFSLGLDAFLEYRTERFSSQLALFTNRIDNYVDFSPTGRIHEPSGLPVFEYTSKDAIMYGFEYSAKLALTNVLQAGLGVDYVRGRERTGEEHNLTFIPPFRTHIDLKYDNGNFWAGPRLKVVNKQDKVAPNEDPTNGYILIGADAGYRFGHGITLTMRMDNVLNESYRDHLSRVENREAPMPGRNLNLMARWEF